MKIFFVSGEEILLNSNSLAKIIKHLRSLDFLECISYDVNASFDWDKLLNEVNTNSLFSQKRIFKIYINQVSLSAKASNSLCKLLMKSSDEIAVIVHTQTLHKKYFSSKWYKEILSSGEVIHNKKFNQNQILDWIKKGLRDLKVRNIDQISELIAINSEGNLLAADQEIKKIALTYPSGEIDLDDYKKYITEQSKYSIFNLIDSSFLGKSHQVIKIFKTLSDDSSFPIILSSSLYRELNNLINMSIDIRMGNSLEEVYQTHGVWSYKKNIVKTALLKHSFQHLQKFLTRLSRVDRAIKGRDNIPVLEELESILLCLSGVKNVS